ncbi:DUF2922 domain-containing protein [Bacillus sp. FJAT-42376]|uniref:DUF2922 domain-containing protein n=1 Tax=Bacillus sp. FJAT-42376 TaxID=2014076 RepID=UPI000F4EE0C2|nr:DUF2922 domain-containing protein [Bacillus sp. FJAT-42376]AZB42580.1 DUF2922 domain-containing protein [Bacillus sp. FJAT-42376]
MAKTLEMQFVNEQGKTVTISVDAPKESITNEEIAAAMDGLLGSGVFTSGGGNLTSKKGARTIDRTVKDMDIK